MKAVELRVRSEVERRAGTVFHRFLQPAKRSILFTKERINRDDIITK